MLKLKGSVTIGVLVYAITLIVCVAMFLPKNIGNVLEITASAEATYGLDDIKSRVGCSVDLDGTYTILQTDPQLIFAIQDDTIESIRLTATSADRQEVAFEVYTAYEDGQFSQSRCYKGNILSHKQSAIIDIPKGEYSFLRVDIDKSNVKFESIEVFDEQPNSIPYLPKFPVQNYIFTAIIPILISIVALLLNFRFKMSERLAAWALRNKIKIVTAVIFAVVALLFAILIELLVGLFTADNSFNVYRWLIFTGAAEVVVVFALGYKSLSSKPENIFLPIVLILGGVMLFGSPIKHICWDLDSHYPWAVQASYPGTTYITAAYDSIDSAMPQSLVLSTSVYEQDIKYLSEAEEIFVSETDSKFTISHLPSGIFIAVARLFGAGFEAKYNTGRLAYLLVYAFACYFAIKKIKSGKMILATICMFPTNLFLATNYTYDWCVTAFTILGTAYFVGELQQPNKAISLKDTVIMSASFAIGALPKLPYIILMGMTLFMRKNWSSKRDKRRYYAILIGVFAVVFALFVLRSMSSLGGSGDTRGGAVNPSAQLGGILENPFGYVKMLAGFLSKYLSIGTMKEYISHFAYLGIGKYSIMFIVILAVTALSDTNGKKDFKIPVYMKALSIVLFVGMAAIIATALYISFTPVGAQTVNGCQPRYIIPLLAPLLLLVTGRRLNVVKNKAVYNGCILLMLSAGVLMETYMQIIKTMI